MANVNRTVANMSKNPWKHVGYAQSEREANEKADAFRAEGKKARVTSYKFGSRKKPARGWQVWVVEE